jgi:hypothetical protein
VGSRRDIRKKLEELRQARGVGNEAEEKEARRERTFTALDQLLQERWDSILGASATRSAAGYTTR